jgi:hypothetical protein
MSSPRFPRLSLMMVGMNEHTAVHFIGVVA